MSNNDKNRSLEEIEQMDGEEVAETMEQPDTKRAVKKKKTKDELHREEMDTINERLLRIVAEYDNYRKRTEREKLQSSANGTAHAIERLLPVLDTLEMAAAADTTDIDYKKGVEMTVALFHSALQILSVTEIKSLGEQFDPNVHNCVASEKTDGIESGIITRVMQKGYMLNDRVIRPSVVAVAE